MGQQRGRRVAEAMITAPHVHRPETSAAQLRGFFADDHVHLALVVEDARLVVALTRDDLVAAAPETRARELGSPASQPQHRVHPDADLDVVLRAMREDGVRRLAVVDDTGRLHGLLCLKRSGRGFCSAADLAERRAGD